MPVQCVCENPSCGKAFFKNPSEIARGAGHYCSRSCASAAQKHVRLCLNPACQKPFITLTCRIKRGGGIYCSLACSRNKALEERFWEKVQVCSHGKECFYCCFLWKGATDGQGYGVLAINDTKRTKKLKTHRIAYELLNKRALIYPLKACHHCDTKLCVNGMHLYAGTQYQNIQDAVRRNRVARGERQAKARLHTTDIPMIWARRAQGATLQEIAGMLAVCDQTIGDVLRLRTWKHVSHSVNGPQP
jgi:hypothetical protein